MPVGLRSLGAGAKTEAHPQLAFGLSNARSSPMACQTIQVTVSPILRGESLVDPRPYLRPMAQIGGAEQMDLLAHVLAHFLFRISARWVLAHQDNRAARFLLKHRGPRQDVAWMTRSERFRSAWTFLLWGIASGALLAVTIYGWSKLAPDDDSVVYMCIVWFLMIFTLMGLGGGIYLFVRGLTSGISEAVRRRRR